MVKNKIKINQIYKNIPIFIILLIIIMLITMPSIAINSFSNGILIWAKKVLPSLLPFFVLTRLLSYTTFINTIGKKLTPITQKLFGVGGVSGYIYCMSIISGYPLGAKLTADMYQNNTINKSQAETITSFTSTSGPLFILGSVAISLFKNIKLGYIILISHYLSALINGLFYKNKLKTKIQIQNKETITNPFNDSMSNSISSILIIGGFISIFYMILDMLLNINFFNFIIYPLSKLGINKELSLSVLSGLIEVTTGCVFLSETNFSIKIIAPILSFLISFGGLSIHAQAYCFLKQFKMSYKIFLKQKFTHAIISIIITYILIMFI